MKPLIAVLAVALAGCGPEGQGEADELDTLSNALKIPTENRISLLDVGSWNVEWYGSTANGPSDEALQQANVQKVIAGMNLDLLGLTEVVSEAAFQTLSTGLRNHTGLLATDPKVENGRAFYSANEQKVGLIFHSRFTVDRARLVLTDDAYAFGGRPPLEVQLSFVDHGKPQELTVLVVHLKALSDADSLRRRTDSAIALKAYLDEQPAGRQVLVIGDFNDDLFSSQRPGAPSPFAAFVADPGHWRFATQALSEAHVSTTVHFKSTIDHHLASATMFEHYVADSVKVVRPDAAIPGYGDTTSDHYPVVSRYDFR